MGSANKKEETTMTLLAAALAYAAAGYPVFPCQPDKSPYTKNGYKDATTDPAQIELWWKEHPHALIGMPTGMESGVAVVDLDIKKGKDGFKQVTDWETRSSVISRTMTGGAHLFFQNDDRVYCTSDKIAKGVDTRGEGGYVIVPPSPGYRWHNGHDFNNLPDYPDDLFPPERNYDRESNDELLAKNPAEALCALAVIPNDDLGWDDWNKFVMAAWGATDGSDEALEAVMQWSAKSSKHNQRATLTRWSAIGRSPPTKLGAGTLYYEASEIDPSWLDRVSDWLDEQHKDYDGTTFFDFYNDTVDGRQDEQSSESIKEPPKTNGSTPNDPPPKKKSSLLVSSAEFVAGFVPPDYLIDGLIQRRFLYSLTAQTNTGKTTVALLLAALVAEGIPLGKREIEQGKVLFFAGENPDDVRMRWIKLCEDRKIDPATTQMVWVPGSISINKLASRLKTESKDHGPFSLIIIDTSAVYFEGKDENDNKELGDYARKILRPLVDLHGGPTILVLCHPIKDVNNSYLVPRGGGAFLNEVDGNLVLTIKSETPKVIELHWQGKFRGNTDFNPIPFKLVRAACKDLKDSKGREMWTVIAKTMTEKESDESDEISIQNQDRLLTVMKVEDGRSLYDYAEAIGWKTSKDEPNKTLAYNTMKDLEKRKLVMKRGNRYHLTKQGKEAKTGREGEM